MFQQLWPLPLGPNCAALPACPYPLPYPQVVSYSGPRPPIGTHRYAFLLFAQPSQEPLQVPAGYLAACLPVSRKQQN